MRRTHVGTTGSAISRILAIARPTLTRSIPSSTVVHTESAWRKRHRRISTVLTIRVHARAWGPARSTTSCRTIREFSCASSRLAHWHPHRRPRWPACRAASSGISLHRQTVRPPDLSRERIQHRFFRSALPTHAAQTAARVRCATVPAQPRAPVRIPVFE